MPAQRNTERGSVMVVAMVTLVALISIGGMSVLAVRTGYSSISHNRAKAIALYAAESGGAAALEYLRANVDAASLWTQVLQDEQAGTLAIPGDDAKPGDPGNLFSPDANAAYEIEIQNNEDDPGFDGDINTAPGAEDTDGRVLVRVTGFGPNGVAAQIEIEVQTTTDIGTKPINNTEGQANGGSDNSGNSSTAVGSGLTEPTSLP